MDPVWKVMSFYGAGILGKWCGYVDKLFIDIRLRSKLDLKAITHILDWDWPNSWWHRFWTWRSW